MSLAIPKRQLDAVIHMIRGGPREGALFLGTSSVTHDGPERLVEYLDAVGRFLPFAQRSDVLFLARGAVVILTVRANEEAGADLDGGLSGDGAGPLCEPRVRLELRTGQVVEGDLVGAMPPENRRVLDYLNHPRWFLPVRQCEDLHVVNKRFIACARSIPAQEQDRRGPWLRLINS